MSIFTPAISCLTTSNLLDSWTYHSRFLCNIALYRIILYFHHQSHPQLCAFFSFLHIFILSEVISPLISTYPPAEFIFQYCIFLPFHTVQQWPAAGLEALSAAVPVWDLLKKVAITFITSTIVWSQVTEQGGNTAPPINR